MKIRFLVIGVFAFCFVFNPTYSFSQADHDSIIGETDISANAENLTKTIVSPTLDRPIQEGKNIIWCATFQLAWDQLRVATNGPVQFEKGNKTADTLNAGKISPNDLDDKSYIALAGKGQTTISNIKEALKTKFSGAARPNLLPASLDENQWILYAYLFQHLPFKHAFTRMEYPFTFSDVEVTSFGIYQYLPDIQENEALMAKQVLIYDYRGIDDFIVELMPSNGEHRIILAHIPPLGNLKSMVNSVRSRCSNSKPTKMLESSTLKIPIINFHVLKTYSEFQGSTISSTNPEINGTPFGIAIQSIRFKLDETGAVLKSEDIAFLSASQDLVFRKPFLILLEKRNSSSPYLAIWVENEELLTPYKGKFGF